MGVPRQYTGTAGRIENAQVAVYLVEASDAGHVPIDRSCMCPEAGSPIPPDLRAELATRGVGYVLAVACDHPVLAAGESYRADALLRGVPARAWQCVSAGRGAKGHRLDDWAFIRLDNRAPSPGGQAGQHWLLVHRNHRTAELALDRCWTPRPRALGHADPGRRPPLGR